MGILSRKITAFLKKVADLPDRPGGTMTTAALKGQFDSSPEELRVAHNGLVDDLASTTAGASGASQIGSETITGVAGNDVFTQVKDIKTQLSNVVLNQIPDGTVTPAKLSFSPAITANDVLTRLLTVDGPASGIDAATVRGWYFRDTNGFPEYTIDGGGSWKPVGGLIDFSALTPITKDASGIAGSSVFQTILSISGKGFIESFHAVQSAASAGFQLRITADGVVKVLLGNALLNKPIGVVGKSDIRYTGGTNQQAVPVPNSATFNTLNQPTALKPYPTTDGSDGMIVLGDTKIYFMTSLLLEISVASGTTYSYHYDGGYK